MVVKEKSLQGGGLVPVVGGEDHLPVEWVDNNSSILDHMQEMLSSNFRFKKVATIAERIHFQLEGSQLYTTKCTTNLIVLFFHFFTIDSGVGQWHSQVIDIGRALR